MMKWIVLAAVIALFAAVVVHGIVKRKKGGGGCLCGCSNCAMKESCHQPE